MSRGLSHITFMARDLDRMEAILTAILDARKVYDSGEAHFSLSRERFYLVGSPPVWIAVMEGESPPARSYNHIAFKIDDGEAETKLAVIRALGLDIRESRPRIEGEGRSIYFYDHDNHLFELHTGTLEERLARYGRSK
jgi:fosfomycin resistance protein FosX